MSELIIKYKRLSIIVVVALFLYGSMQALRMPKSEDPDIAPIAGMITVIYPGATPEEILKFIAEPLEDELSEIELIQDVDITIRSEVALARIRLNEKLSDEVIINNTWDEIRRALDRAKLIFPDGVSQSSLNDNLLDKEAIVLSVTSHTSLIELKQTVDYMRSELLKLDHVKNINLNADPGEQISIHINDQAITPLGLSYFDILSQIKRSNQSIPAGTLKLNDKTLALRTNSTFKSLDEIRAFPLLLKSGNVIKLADIARIERTIDLPRRNSMYLNGEQAIGLGIVLAKNIDLIDYGPYFMKEFEKLKQRYPAYQLTIISYFPDNVKSRILDLTNSLMVGIASLAVVLMILMGLRLGLLVSIIVPVITVMSLGLFAGFGGVLQQISISAFVMAIGLLVDNVIVISESIQDKLNKGRSRLDATLTTISEFSLPLFAATGTTVASFVPMMISEGPAAQFTRSLAVVLSITLIISYLFSIFATPIFAGAVLGPTKSRGSNFLTSFSVTLAHFIKNWHKVITIIILCIIGLGIFSMGSLKKKFFPYADRDQLVIDLRLPEGTHFDQTEQAALTMVERIKKSTLWQDKVTQVATYVGSSTPKFFYNLNLIPNSPHIAQMIVRVTDYSLAPEVRDQLEKLLSPVVTEGILMVRELEQGPPIDAAVQVKIFSRNAKERARITYEVTRFLMELESTKNVRHDLGQGVPEVFFEINDSDALRYNLSRNEVTAIILGRTRGLNVGDYRVDKDPIPILIKSLKGENNTRQEILNSFVTNTQSDELYVKDLAKSQLKWQPSVMKIDNGSQVTNVYSELNKGFGYNDVVSQLTPFLATLKTNARIELDGQGAESSKSNKELIKGAPVAFALLLIFLIIQFNSFRKFFIVFSAVPLAFIGLAPSHLLFGFPFGFFSLLGALALIGIIVNNAILIIEFIDLNKKGSFVETLAQTFMARLRPIFLTTITTIIGLLPLAFSDATLWPPFAWTIIFGLFFGSLLTIFFVPSLYLLVFPEHSPSSPNSSGLGKKVLAALVIPLLFLPPHKSFAARKTSLEQVMSMADNSPLVKSFQINLEKTKNKSDIDFNATFLPSLGLNLERESYNEQQNLTTPIGAFPFLPENVTRAGVVLNQKVIDLSKMVYQTKANDLKTQSVQQKLAWFKDINRLKVGLTYLENVKIRTKLNALKNLQKNLKSRRREINRLVKLGRLSRVDLLKIDSKIIDIDQAIGEITAILPSLGLRLGQTIGSDLQIEVKGIGHVETLLGRMALQEVLDLDAIPSQRLDIKAIDSQLKSLNREMAMVNSSYLPTLDLEFRGYHQNPSQFQDEYWFSGAVVLRWNLFERGTRKEKKQILANTKRQLQLDKQDIVRSIQVKKSELTGLLRKQKNEIKQRKLNFTKTKRALKLEFDRYKKGRSSLNDLVDAEELVKDAKEKGELAMIQYVQTSLEYYFINGAIKSIFK